MRNELESLKRRLPLVDYLRRHNWVAHKVGGNQEYVGLCPLHVESHPSFYVNADKNLFYCHGCGRGGDLIRFVQLYFHLPFRDSVMHLKEELGLPPHADDELLNDAVSFYQHQLHRHGEAIAWTKQRQSSRRLVLERLMLRSSDNYCAQSLSVKTTRRKSQRWKPHSLR